MALCDVPGCEDHYGCRLRAKGLQVSPKASPAARKPPVFRPAKRDSWAGGTATDDRGLPILRPNGTPVSVKEAAEQRHRITDTFKKLDAQSNQRTA